MDTVTAMEVWAAGIGLIVLVVGVMTWWHDWHDPIARAWRHDKRDARKRGKAR